MEGLDGLDNSGAGAPPSGNPPNNPPPPQVAAAQPPHAGLSAYISRLALGIDAFATSAATGGREGGVQEVQQYDKNALDMKLKTQAAQEQAEDHSLRMKTGIADYNMKQAQLATFIQDMPLHHQQLSNQIQESTLDLLQKKGVPLGKAVAMTEGQNQDDHVNALRDATSGDFTSNYVLPVYGKDGPKGAGGNTHVIPSNSVMGLTLNSDDVGPTVAAMNRNLDQAKAMLGDKDPSVQKAQGQIDLITKNLAGGGSIGMPDWLRLTGTMNTELHAAMEQKKDLTKFRETQADLKEKQQKADPLFKMENEPSEMAGEKSAAAIPLLQNKLTAPETSPQDKVRASRLLSQAKSAHAAFQADQVQKANAEQQAKQGDPNEAGKLLANGSLTLADMKTRGMTPKFMQQSIAAAQGINKDYKPADEVIAEQVAKSPQAGQFFGSANSLISKGGTLDQLIEQGKSLPDVNFPIFNKALDATNYAAGHKDVAAYLMTALGTADDYAKVVGGGQPSEHMQMLIFNKLNAALNEDQRKGVVDAMRGSVNSQVESRIGKNQFLKRMYGYALPGGSDSAKPVTPFDPSKDFKPIKP